MTDCILAAAYPQSQLEEQYEYDEGYDNEAQDNKDKDDEDVEEDMGDK